ncbi:MAG: GAF domain-containing protein [Magnetococcales bacterium]|nr:GAF domain-containing protein [Magnetococcales bacterium]
MAGYEHQLKRNQLLQEVLNSVLKFSLEPLSLESFLEHTLDLLLGIPQLALDAKGAIFLADEKNQILHMAAQRSLPESLQSACGRVPFGKCLCGRAAESATVLFSDHLDDRHDIRYTGIQNHGHYCIPILSGDKTLGVINLYVRPGHATDKQEVDFLQAITHTLAGVIERKRAEEALIKAREDLDSIVRKQTTKNIFNRTIIHRIFDLWDRGGQGERWPAPSFTDIKLILETIFFASLKQKEENPIKVSVSLVESMALLDEVAAYDGMTVLFDHPFPFTADTLVNLSPAFDPSTTSLVVMPEDGTPGRLEIHGAIYFSARGLHRFDALTFARTPLDIFTVAAKKAGHLLIFRGNDVIGRYASGVFCEPTSLPFTESPMAWNLLKVVRGHPEFRELDMGYWQVYRDLIDRLLLETARRGQGGAILWMPEALLEHSTAFSDPKFRLTKRPDGAQLIGRYRHLEERLEAGEPGADFHRLKQELALHKKHLIDLVELLAHFSRVDGALILSDRLQPISFGTLITAPPWKGQVISWLEERLFPSVHVDFNRFGSRHTSAVNLIGQCPGAIAFVISQDGPIAGITRKNENTIYWWPDCLSKLWDA